MWNSEAETEEEWLSYAEEEAKALKERLDANGIAISAVGSPIGKISITDPFEPHLETLRHVIKLAKIWETNYIRMFSFLRKGNRQIRTVMK